MLRGLILLIFTSFPVFGDDFPELPNTESTTDADPPSPEESAKSFSLPDGFGVSVWAGEPSSTTSLTWPKLGPRVRRFALEPAAVPDECAPLLVFVNPGSGGRRGRATLRALPWRGIGVVRPSILRAPPSRGAAPTAPTQFLSAAS